MKFTDAVAVAGTRRRDDGYLVADCRVARTGIQLYAGYEVGKPEMPVVRVYRPDSEVFSKDTLASFAHRPVTNDHPPEMVTADNWREHAVGQSGDEIARDGTFIRVPLMVADGEAIKALEGGKRELSAGYSCTLDFTAGTSPEGEQYDAVQRNIRANHVAIVERGRAGSQCRVGDADPHHWGIAPISLKDREHTPMTLRKVMVDGLSVETTEQGVEAITKLQNDKAGLTTKLSDAETAHKTVIAAKDEEIGTLKADLKKAQDALPKAGDLDRMVADRAALVEMARKIAKDIKVEGLSDAEIRREAVKAVLGEDTVKDASDAEVVGMFKAISKDAGGTDPVRDALRSAPRRADTNDNGQSAYEKRLTDGWKPQKGA